MAKLGSNYWKLWTTSAVSNFGDGVSTIAYPWLASAITRNPVQISLIAVATRLPWLIFTLPAGVITDRVDRRKIMVAMDTLRFALTIAVAVVVLAGRSVLASPDAIAGGAPSPKGPDKIIVDARRQIRDRPGLDGDHRTPQFLKIGMMRIKRHLFIHALIHSVCLGVSELTQLVRQCCPIQVLASDGHLPALNHHRHILNARDVQQTVANDAGTTAALDVLNLKSFHLHPHHL